MKIRVIDFLVLIANNKKHLPRYVVLLGKTYTDIYRIIQWNGYTYEFADGREFNLMCLDYLELNDEVYIPEEFVTEKLQGYSCKPIMKRGENNE